MRFGKERALDLSPNSPSDAAMAKETFSEETSIEPERLVLTHNGIELEDDRKLCVGGLQHSTAIRNLTQLRTEDLNLYAEQSLRMTLRPEEPKILGIGVGGTIVQHIVPDSTDPRLWAFANSKMIHVQILNATAFKSYGHRSSADAITDEEAKGKACNHSGKTSPGSKPGEYLYRRCF